MEKFSRIFQVHLVFEQFLAYGKFKMGDKHTHVALQISLYVLKRRLLLQMQINF